MINNKMEEAEDNMMKRIDDEINRPNEAKIRESEDYKNIMARMEALENKDKNPTSNNKRKLQLNKRFPAGRNQRCENPAEEFPEHSPSNSNNREATSIQEEPRQAMYSSMLTNTGAIIKLRGNYVSIEHFKERYNNSRRDETIAKTFDDNKLERMFEESAEKVAIFPVTREDIVRWSYQTEGKDPTKDADKKVFYSPDYENERYEQTMHILTRKYQFYENEFPIKDIHYCIKESAKMIIMTTTKEFTTTIFKRAAAVRDRSINVIQHVPGPALKGKRNRTSY